LASAPTTNRATRSRPTIGARAAVPHFFYHLLNTEVASPGQQAVLTIANAFVALLGLVPIPVALLRDRRTA
jgi:hypothetical protein